MDCMEVHLQHKIWNVVHSSVALNYVTRVFLNYERHTVNLTVLAAKITNCQQQLLYNDILPFGGENSVAVHLSQDSRIYIDFGYTSLYKNRTS